MSLRPADFDQEAENGRHAAENGLVGQDVDIMGKTFEQRRQAWDSVHMPGTDVPHEAKTLLCAQLKVGKSIACHATLHEPLTHFSNHC
jgi:hypothetical protein